MVVRPQLYWHILSKIIIKSTGEVTCMRERIKTPDWLEAYNCVFTCHVIVVIRRGAVAYQLQPCATY